MGGASAFTIDESGNVTKIGMDSPSSGEFLKWDGGNSKAVWDSSTLNDLTDVLVNTTNFYSSLLIQTNRLGLVPTTGILDSAKNNIGIGHDVFKSLTSGTNNIVIGGGSSEADTGPANALTTGYQNIALGTGTGRYWQTAFHNVAIGWRACGGENVDSMAPDNNICIGYKAGSSIKNTRNICIGSHAGLNIADGHLNTFLGHSAGMGDSSNFLSGSNNTFIGAASGKIIESTAEDNTLLGTYSGNKITTGIQNVILGSLSNPSGFEATNQIVIGYYTEGLGDNTAVIGNQNIEDVYMNSNGNATVHCSVVSSNSTTALKLTTNQVTDAGSITIGNGPDAPIYISPNGNGAVKVTTIKTTGPPTKGGIPWTENVQAIQKIDWGQCALNITQTYDGKYDGAGNIGGKNDHAGNAIAIRSKGDKNDIDKHIWLIGLDGDHQEGTGGEHPELVFQYRETETDSIRYGLHANPITNTKMKLDFTGQHKCYGKDNNIIDYTQYIGYITVSTGIYNSQSTGPDITNIKNIFINESLPIVELSNKNNQKSVFGVISLVETDETRTRTYQNIMRISYDKPEGDNRLTINSLGEGAVWVSNYSGNFENGDYITSCVIPGIGCKQADDILHNYTVGKITCGVDFDNLSTTDPFEYKEIVHDGVPYKCVFVGCTYHCG